MSLQKTTGIPIPINKSNVKSTGDLLAVPYFHQHVTEWCWAACAQMLFHTLNVNKKSQCEMAEEAFFPHQCCTTPQSNACNKPYYPKLVFQGNGVPYKDTASAVSFQAIDTEIKAGRPLEIFWKWNGSTAGHLLLISGTYKPIAPNLTGDLHIIDPRKSNSVTGRMEYDEVMSAMGKGNWTYTFFEINK